MDGINQKLVNLLQAEFPLKPRPYREIGLKLSVGEEEVIQRIERLKAEGLVRQISPVLDSRRLGFQTTLVAMRVTEDQLDKAAQVIADHPAISHGYQREHHFNLWFTLSAPSLAEVETELEQLAVSTEAEAAFSLPAVKVFKIGAYFGTNGNGKGGGGVSKQFGGTLPKKAELSQVDRAIVNELQQDLPLRLEPFAHMAGRLGMEVEDFLSNCQSLRERGIMRRFGAAVNHRKAGFEANAMACWVVPQDKVEAVGQKLSSFQEVSHCYERRTNSLWPYGLFAVIHSYTRKACQSVVQCASQGIGLEDYVLLFSTREFKKTRVKYLV